MSTSNPQQASYSIGVVARLTGLTTHTLRMWERRYGLGASKRTKSGQREFTKVDLDHLKLIKKLIDDGLRIGDIARLPKKTLSALNTEGTVDQQTEPARQLFPTTVIGSSAGRFFGSHSKRYPSLSLEFSSLTFELWMEKLSAVSNSTVIVVEINTINNQRIKLFKKLSDENKSIIICCPSINSKYKSELASSGLIILEGLLTTENVDPAIKKASELQTVKTLLKQSTERFNVDLPAELPRLFDEKQLNDASASGHILQCECPSHISALIKQLNEFEQYSQQCGAEDWKQAATHACIYAYTSQARSLMEQALIAVLSEESA